MRIEDPNALTVGGRRLLTVRAAAKRLEVSERRIRQLLQDGTLEAQVVLGQRVVTQVSCDKYHEVRRAWNRYQVLGGRAAAVRLGVLPPSLEGEGGADGS